MFEYPDVNSLLYYIIYFYKIQDLKVFNFAWQEPAFCDIIKGGVFFFFFFCPPKIAAPAPLHVNLHVKRPLGIEHMFDLHYLTIGWHLLYTRTFVRFTPQKKVLSLVLGNRQNSCISIKERLWYLFLYYNNMIWQIGKNPFFHLSVSIINEKKAFVNTFFIFFMHLCSIFFDIVFVPFLSIWFFDHLLFCQWCIILYLYYLTLLILILSLLTTLSFFAFVYSLSFPYLSNQPPSCLIMFHSLVWIVLTYQY